MKRKILAFALAALMLVSVLPTSVFAAEANGECAYQGKAHTLELVPNAEQVGEPVAPKCGEPGYTLFECPDCGAFFADNFLPSLGEHNWKVTAEKIPATCGVNGKEAVEICQNEGCNVVKGGDIIPALKHNYEISVAEGDCVNGAVITSTCANCGDVQVEAKDPEAHTWSVHPIIDVAPTGGKDGSAHYVCEVCGVSSKPIVVKAGCYGIHIRQRVEAVAPTCDKAGNIAYETCEGCNKLYLVGTNIEITEASTVIPANGHDFVEVGREAATCTEDGVIKYECTICDAKDEKAIPAACLYADEPSHVVAPTCTTPGVEIYFCLLCQQPKQVEYTPANGHGSYAEALKKYNEAMSNLSLVQKDAITMDGDQAWNGLEYVFTAPFTGVFTLKADAPNVMQFDSDYYAVELDVTASLKVGEKVTLLLTDPNLWWGEISFNMIVMGVEVSMPIEVKPTCELDGERVWVCHICGAECSEDGETVAELAATGHKTETKRFEATCSYPAYTINYCVNANCDHDAVAKLVIENGGKKYEVPTLVDGKPVRIDSYVSLALPAWAVNPDSHVWLYEEMNPATCTEPGDYTRHCSLCKAYEQGIIEPSHELKKGETIEATCQHYGYTVQYCVNCDFEEEIDIVEFALQDNYSMDEAQTKHSLASEAEYTGIPYYSQDTWTEDIRWGGCEEVGLKKVYCKDCKQHLLVVVDGTGEGHKWPQNQADIEYLEKKYSNEYYDATGAFWFAKAPTCTEAGQTHYYRCLDCGKESGETAYDESWNIVPVVIPALNHMNGEESCIVKLDAVAPTCTTSGLTAGEYCTICDYKVEQIVLPATKHANYTQVDGHAVSCDQFGYNVYKCDDCAEYYFIAEYIPAHGHKNPELVGTEYLCEEGKVIYTYSCGICRQYTVEEAIEGHMNNGALIVPSCLDVKCDNCGIIVEAAHEWFTIQVPATCYEWGYDLKICSLCKESYVTNIDDSYLADHSWNVVESKPATYLEAGWEKLECSVCGAEDERVLPVLSGIEFIAVVDNAVASGAGYADSSLIKLTIKLDSAASLKLSSVGFDVNYEKEVVEFVKAEFVSEHFTTLCLANDNDGFVTVTANVPNKAEGDRDDYAVEDHALVDLYFRVKNDVAVKAEFSFGKLECRDVEYKLLNAQGSAAEIAIVKFMDLNRDGDINLADCMMAYDIMAGASEVMYDVAIDLNKDGKIGLDDVMALYEFYAGIKAYEDVYKMGI